MPKLIINFDRCKSCLLCASVCPKKILKRSNGSLNKKGYYPIEIINQDECIGCAMCATMCPDYVLTVEK